MATHEWQQQVESTNLFATLALPHVATAVPSITYFCEPHTLHRMLGSSDSSRCCCCPTQIPAFLYSMP